MVDLRGETGRLGSELLHPFFPYGLDHLKRATLLSDPMPETDLAVLRNAHLERLHQAHGRTDFGDWMPDSGSGSA